jgi:hypothetical protein
MKAGYSNVVRYQLGLPVWRALGDPVAIERDGIARILKADQTAIAFISRVCKGDPGKCAQHCAGRCGKAKLPEDDFQPSHRAVRGR